jgi:hypothetical protein
MKNEEMEITESLKFYINNIDKFEAITEEYKTKNKSILNMISNAIVDSLNEEGIKYQYSKNTNKYVQIYKDNWENKNHNGVHFEILFDTVNIVGKVINADIVLHIENNIKENRLKNFEKNKITVKSTLAYYQEEPIRKRITLDLTSFDKIQEAIELIISIFKEYALKYEKIIDKSFIE